MIFHHTAFKIRWKLMPNTPHHYYTWQPCAHVTVSQSVSQSVSCLGGRRANFSTSCVTDLCFFVCLRLPRDSQGLYVT